MASLWPPGDAGGLRSLRKKETPASGIYKRAELITSPPLKARKLPIPPDLEVVCLGGTEPRSEEQSKVRGRRGGTRSKLYLLKCWGLPLPSHRSPRAPPLPPEAPRPHCISDGPSRSSQPQGSMGKQGWAPDLRTCHVPALDSVSPALSKIQPTEGERGWGTRGLQGPLLGACTLQVPDPGPGSPAVGPPLPSRAPVVPQALAHLRWACPTVQSPRGFWVSGALSGSPSC